MPNEWDDALRGLGLVTPDDAYDPFASEKFASPAARGALQGATQFVATPGQLASTSNPYPPGTEQSDFFERSRAQAGESWAHGAALGMLGGGTGFVRGAPGEVVLGAAGAGPKSEAWLDELDKILKDYKPSADLSEKSITSSLAANKDYTSWQTPYLSPDWAAEVPPVESSRKRSWKLAGKGHKVGLIRPITLWPFPVDQVRKAADTAKMFLSVEISMGQMVEDVRLAVNGKVPVEFYGRIGMIPSPEEIAQQIIQLAEREGL